MSPIPLSSPLLPSTLFTFPPFPVTLLAHLPRLSLEKVSPGSFFFPPPLSLIPSCHLFYYPLTPQSLIHLAPCPCLSIYFIFSFILLLLQLLLFLFFSSLRLLHFYCPLAFFFFFFTFLSSSFYIVLSFPLLSSHHLFWYCHAIPFHQLSPLRVLFFVSQDKKGKRLEKASCENVKKSQRYVSQANDYFFGEDFP